MLLRACHEGFFVPDIRLPLSVGRYSPPGFFWGDCWSVPRLPTRYPWPFGPCLSASFGRSYVTMVHHIFTCVTPGQLCSTGFQVRLLVTAFYSRFRR